jgi:hypothetical protein
MFLNMMVFENIFRMQDPQIPVLSRSGMGDESKNYGEEEEGTSDQNFISVTNPMPKPSIANQSGLRK